MTSPGWRPDSVLLHSFQAAGVEVIGDVELAYRLDRAEVFGPPRIWLVVTGTNGKTTTTGMLTQIMQADTPRSGLRAQAVGNIGVSLFDALTATSRVDVLCAELSSFQLHWSSELRPDVGVLLNVAEDHLDWHGSFDAYARAKAKALHGTCAVVGRDDAVAGRYVEGIDGVYGFTAGEPASGEVGVSAGRLVSRLGGGQALDLGAAEGIEPAGLAGVLDAAAAASVACLAGASPAAIQEGLAAYAVAGHRGAVVHEHGGVSYIDNSKATNPHAADAALGGYDSVIWIAGGQLKGADVDELIATHAARLKAAVLMGIDKSIIAAALARHAPHTRWSSLRIPTRRWLWTLPFAPPCNTPRQAILSSWPRLRHLWICTPEWPNAVMCLPQRRAKLPVRSRPFLIRRLHDGHLPAPAPLDELAPAN